MRCFIAIDIDEKSREALGDLQRRLAGEVEIKKGDVKWVRPESIHLTLKFLGEIKDEKVVEVCNIVRSVAAGHNSFELGVESVGCFGGRSARVLWVGTGEGNEALLRLQKDIESALARAGYPEEGRQYSGHLTLCRIKDTKAGIRLAQISEQYKQFRIGTISADSVCVYQSRLTPKGPIYIRLGNFALQ